MLVDGKKLAEELNAQTARMFAGHTKPPLLAIIVAGDDPVIENFVRIKKRVGESIGVRINERRFPATTSTEDLVRDVQEIANNDAVSGVVVQLPLPSGVDVERVLGAVPPDKDVDMLSRESVARFACGNSSMLPPVAGAIKAILAFARVPVSGKEALILGHGRLVGMPAAILLKRMGAHTTVIDKPVADLAIHAKESAIIICGTGNPGILTKEMLSPGTVVIDAGTSEQRGKIVGDADPDCADIAGVLTPVPGGVGPVAIAMLFRNLGILTAINAFPG